MNPTQFHLLGFDQPLTDAEILRAFAPGEFFTRKMLAEKLGRSKSPTLVTRINRMAQEGLYSVQTHTLPNGVDMWIYSLTEAGIEAWEKARNEWVAERVDALFG